MDDVDIVRLSASEIDELAIHGLWRSLAGDPTGDALLNGVREEERRRGVERLQQARRAVHRAVMDACERVERSAVFAQAGKLRMLLRLIVESTLESGEPIKQELLGRKFYGRSDFDRAALATEVRRLRKRLDDYYRAPAIDDAIRFQIPKGQYIAVVRRLVSTEAARS